MDKISHLLESDKPFDTVVENIETESVNNQFRVLHVHDVQATLAEKGFERKPLKIIEVCNAKFANEALNKEINVSLFMPCKFSVYKENDKTMVSLARPTMISEMLPHAGLDEMASEVEKTLIKVMEAAV